MAFFLSAVKKMKNDLIIELLSEEPKFVETLNTKAKIVLKLVKPNFQFDEKKLQDQIDPDNDGIVYEIVKGAKGPVLKLGGAADIEIHCASIEKFEVEFSAKDLFEALKEWRASYHDAENRYSESHKQLHELAAYCEKTKSIAEKKLSEAKWLNESQKGSLGSRIEVLSHILELLKDSH